MKFKKEDLFNILSFALIGSIIVFIFNAFSDSFRELDLNVLDSCIIILILAIIYGAILKLFRR